LLSIGCATDIVAPSRDNRAREPYEAEDKTAPQLTPVHIPKGERMVHLRLNAREANPNPHVNWITALSQPSQDSTTAARDLLKALAAQVRPVMKKHGYP